VKCQIRRLKTGGGLVSKGSILYVLELQKEDGETTRNQFLLAGKKRSGNKSSNYLISVDKADLSTDSDAYIAKLRSNYMGTEFTVYDDGVNPEKIDQVRLVALWVWQGRTYLPCSQLPLPTFPVDCFVFDPSPAPRLHKSAQISSATDTARGLFRCSAVISPAILSGQEPRQAAPARAVVGALRAEHPGDQGPTEDDGADPGARRAPEAVRGPADAEARHAA